MKEFDTVCNEILSLVNDWEPLLAFSSHLKLHLSEIDDLINKV